MKKIFLFVLFTFACSYVFAVNSIGNGKIAINVNETSVPYITLNSSNVFVSTPTYIKGSITNDSDVIGFYGESVTTSTIANSTATTSTQYSNMLSASLTAGIWDCSAMGISAGPNAAGWTDVSLAISINSGNTTTDHLNAVNVANFTAAFGNNDRQTLSIPPYRITLNATSPVYLKQEHTYSGAAPSMRFAGMHCVRPR